MARDLLQEGMNKFTSGDLVGATRLWLELIKKEPANEHALSYLARIREVAPELLEQEAVGINTAKRTGEMGGDALASSPDLSDGPSGFNTLVSKLNYFLEIDDFSDAFEVAKELLQLRPNYEPAVKALALCEKKLEFIFASKIGDHNAVPRVLLPDDEILWLDLDNKAGFVLSQIDGKSSFQEILTVTGMSRVDSLRILARLVKNKVIGI